MADTEKTRMRKREAKMEIIDTALREGRKTLSEFESKKLLAAYNIAVTKEFLVDAEKNLAAALKEIGYPLVMKGCAAEIAHKTEKGLIKVDIRTEAEAKGAFQEIMAGMAGAKGGVLVQEMIKGQRELVLGMTRDPQFGPCVMFGLGGIFTEVLKDVTFRVAPLEMRDALEMMDEIRARKLLDAFRGKPAVNRDILAHALINLGRIGLEVEEVAEIDINPMIIHDDMPIAVDALVILRNPKAL
jgi:acetyl-CoA synthetase (ADP-forming)